MFTVVGADDPVDARQRVRLRQVARRGVLWQGVAKVFVTDLMERRHTRPDHRGNREVATGAHPSIRAQGYGEWRCRLDRYPSDPRQTILAVPGERRLHGTSKRQHRRRLT